MRLFSFRAQFVAAVLIVLTPVQALPVDGAAPGQRPPNFIHIMVDDMAWDAMGFRGRHPFLETPNLDKLASNGVVFNEFFVTTSLCSPSRASILTGRYGHATGVPNNTVRKDPNESLSTYPELLQEAGYVTAHIGKWHMGNGDHPRSGFSHWYGFDLQGVYYNPVMNRNGAREEVEGYVTDILTDEAIEFITKNQSRSFALNLWHKAAHMPFESAPRHSGIYDDVTYPKHPTWDNDLSDLSPWNRRLRAYGGHLRNWIDSEGKSIPDAVEARPFTQQNAEKYLNHLSTLLAVDDSVGRVMETLKKLNLLDNTVVIFTADNGFFMGEFARADKRLAYEPSIRVPMILHYPSLALSGEQTSAMGLNIDFAPTFLDWAGVEIPESMQGRSLLPILEGEVELVREHFLYEYFQEAFAPGIPTTLGIRTQRWKYIHYPDDPSAIDELYDLKSDQHEEHSLVGDPSYLEVLNELKNLMQKEMTDLDYSPSTYTFDIEKYKKPSP